MIFVNIECEKCHNHIHGVIEKGYLFGCFKCSSILEVEKSLSISEQILVFFGREIKKIGRVITAPETENKPPIIVSEKKNEIKNK